MGSGSTYIFEGGYVRSTLRRTIFLFQVRQLQGVQDIQETRFWTLCSNYYVGGVKIEVLPNADAKYVISHTQMIFRAIGITQLYVQLDYEHNTNTYQNLHNFYPNWRRIKNVWNCGTSDGHKTAFHIVIVIRTRGNIN